MLGPVLRTVTIHEAYAVLKDYDGNAPDGPVMAICATQTIADELADLLNANDPGRAARIPTPIFADFPWPSVDGWEWSARWVVRKTEAEAAKIALTSDEAFAQAIR